MLKALQVRYSTSLQNTRIRITDKETSGNCKHEQVNLKDCELCLDKFRPELLRDTDMLLMFGKGTRGGITQAVKRYAKANNKYMKDQYNPDGKSTYLQCSDANNLYGWTMIQKLPKHRIAWEKNVVDFNREKNRSTDEERQTRVYFRNRCRVSPIAAQET